MENQKMSRKPAISDNELNEIASYLAQPVVEVELHAELPPHRLTYFTAEYMERTRGYPLPEENDLTLQHWRPNVNKRGIQLRIYFLPIQPVPFSVENQITDRGKYFRLPNHCRINHSTLVFQLLECGFLLGPQQCRNRIERFMAERFV